MKAYRIKIEVVAITLEQALWLAREAVSLLPNGWTVGGAIGDCESSCEVCEIGRPESEDDT